MKKFCVTLFITMFMSTQIYASDNWEKNYDRVEETDNGQTYICDKQIGSDKEIIRNYVVDKSGNVLFETNDGIDGTDDPNRYICWKRDFNSKEKVYFEYYIADSKGNPVNDMRYSHINHKIEGLNAYCVEKTPVLNKMGIVDDTGKILLPFEYGIIDFNFVNGYLRITRSDENQRLLNGLIDKSFRVVIPAEYTSIFRANENLFYASKRNNNKFDWYKYENGSLSFFKTTNWDTCSDYSWESNQFIDIIASYDDGKNIRFGTADADLNVICEPKYDNYLNFENGYSIVQYGSTDFSSGNIEAYDGKFGVVDKNGNEVIKCEYDKITRPEKGGFICTKDGKKDIFLFDTNINEPECSSWARNNIVSGNLYGIVPDEINSNFSEKITRGEFCKLVIQAYLKTEGSWSIDEYIENFTKDMKNTFNDTNDKYILLANYKGIVNGKENGNFCPDDFITREEAAVMLANMAKVMNYYNLSAEKVDFIDEQYFSEWAKESIYKLVNFKGEENVSVMTGTETEKFSPKDYYTREQAIVTVVRIYDIREHIFRNEYKHYLEL